MNKKAFTLIEVLIVLLITGIVISMAVPALKGSVKKRLKSSAYKLSAYLSFIQELALIDSKVYRLDIDIDTLKLTLFERDGDAFLETGKTEELDPKLDVQEINCGGDIQYRGICAVYFFPNGSNTGLDIKIGAKKIQDFAYKIELNSLTGKSYVEGIKNKE